MEAAQPEVGRGSWPKRVVLAALIAIVSLNIWTGSPVLALWIGSRIQGDGPPKMSSIFVVAAVLAAVSLGLLRVLAVLQEAYERATGQERSVRAHTPWLRSMAGERPQYPGERAQLTMVERIIVISVVLAAVAFEVWFFFFATSPLPS
jgi:hypothetical protein